VCCPSVYRFKLGDFEVTNLLDGFSPDRPSHPTFGGNLPAETVWAHGKACGVTPDKYEHVYVNTLVNTGRDLVLFDTGNGKGRDANVGKLPELMGQAGYTPDEVDIVVITHGHPDHINGLMVDGKPGFPNARYIFGEVEFDFWKKGENVREARKANREQFVKVAVPLADKATFVKTEGEVLGGIRAIPTFGHSPGHMSYHVESKGQRLLIWADVSNHSIFSVRQPEWHGSFDDDKDAAVVTRKRVFDWVATDRLPALWSGPGRATAGFRRATSSTPLRRVGKIACRDRTRGHGARAILPTRLRSVGRAFAHPTQIGTGGVPVVSAY
jgi:glyoxylase-like metal-dependent hydrolase (beta-lactamase superfamily II)